jgi:hypothetical protein
MRIISDMQISRGNFFFTPPPALATLSQRFPGLQGNLIIRFIIKFISKAPSQVNALSKLQGRQAACISDTVKPQFFV